MNFPAPLPFFAFFYFWGTRLLGVSRVISAGAPVISLFVCWIYQTAQSKYTPPLRFLRFKTRKFPYPYSCLTFKPLATMEKRQIGARRVRAERKRQTGP